MRARKPVKKQYPFKRPSKILNDKPGKFLTFAFQLVPGKFRTFFYPEIFWEQLYRLRHGLIFIILNPCRVVYL